MVSKVKQWNVYSEKTCFKTEWFSVIKSKAHLPNGKEIDDYYSINNRDAVMVVAIDKQLNVVLINEYRLPVNEILTELPAGAIEQSDKFLLDAAKRELAEETGYTSNNWKYIGETFDCPDRCTGKLHLFAAYDAIHCNDQHLDSTEDIDIMIIPLIDAIEMCLNGSIRVNSCCNALFRVYYDITKRA